MRAAWARVQYGVPFKNFLLFTFYLFFPVFVITLECFLISPSAADAAINSLFAFPLAALLLFSRREAADATVEKTLRSPPQDV